jgi:hypothetical protein
MTFPRIARILLLLGVEILTAQASRANVTITLDHASSTSWWLGTERRFYFGEILIDGEIKRGDYAAFVQAADLLHAHMLKAHVADPILDTTISVKCASPGGDVWEAVQIGRLIRKRLMQTSLGPPVCASAGTLIFIAGARRLATFEESGYTVNPGLRIGLHRPTFDPTYFANLAPEEAVKKYNSMVDELRKYFTGMGGTEDAFRLMMSTHPEDISYLNEDEAQRFGFSGRDPAYDEVVSARNAIRVGPVRWRIYKQTCLTGEDDIFKCMESILKRYPKYE